MPENSNSERGADRSAPARSAPWVAAVENRLDQAYAECSGNGTHALWEAVVAIKDRLKQNEERGAYDLLPFEWNLPVEWRNLFACAYNLLNRIDPYGAPKENCAYEEHLEYLRDAVARIEKLVQEIS